VVESAVGAHLVATCSPDVEIGYWREGNLEVDFVLRHDDRLAALEVTSGRRKPSLSGLSAFVDRFGPARTLLVGGQGVRLEEFFLTAGDTWLE
jgi:hypothetical protein